jgi:NAD(P)-dependent dehydrogenase (short-subunit alcohol dehydrogenase family)
MTSQQQFLLGVAAGAAAMIVGGRVARSRRAVDFAGRTVVITGGSRGLGLVLARQLAAEGARLCLMARHAGELERARDELAATGADVMIVRCDIRRRADVRACVDQILDRWTAVDVLINNAGIIQVGPIDHMTLADYEQAMNTHFWGPLYMTMAALPHMRRSGEGRIVNISSIGGRIGLPHLAPYAASKFALTGLSESLRCELARENIVVTTVCPGLMRTGSPLNASMKGRHPQEYAWFAISDSLPLTAIDVERAARQVVAACRHGDAELVITVQAKIAILARTIAPELFAAALAAISRLLPAPTGPEGDLSRLGRDSESEWAPSTLTEPTYRAAEENNEL